MRQITTGDKPAPGSGALNQPEMPCSGSVATFYITCHQAGDFILKNALLLFSQNVLGRTRPGGLCCPPSPPRATYTPAPPEHKDFAGTSLLPEGARLTDFGKPYWSSLSSPVKFGIRLKTHRNLKNKDDLGTALHLEDKQCLFPQWKRKKKRAGRLNLAVEAAQSLCWGLFTFSAVITAMATRNKDQQHTHGDKAPVKCLTLTQNKTCLESVPNLPKHMVSFLHSFTFKENKAGQAQPDSPAACPQHRGSGALGVTCPSSVWFGHWKMCFFADPMTESCLMPIHIPALQRRAPGRAARCAGARRSRQSITLLAAPCSGSGNPCFIVVKNKYIHWP